MKSPISEKAYKKALACGRGELSKPHAVSASYSKKSHRLTILFSDGLSIGFDTRNTPFFSQHPNADLSDPYVTPGGDGIVFDHAELSASIPGLIAQAIPIEAARQAVASIMGAARSEKKAAAARTNGAKGGRPRKELAAA